MGEHIVRIHPRARPGGTMLKGRTTCVFGEGATVPDKLARAITPSRSLVVGRLLVLLLRGPLSPCHCEERSDEAIPDTIALVSRQYYVHIMTNKRNNVLYVGVTSDLVRRVYDHREKLADGFTKKYNIVKLVYYEVLEDIENAILREKQIKAGPRRKKVRLVNDMNSEWRDLYKEL
ncbi:GIY-YIG nuclease family protein [Chloroflexota bacterium]